MSLPFLITKGERIIKSSKAKIGLKMELMKEKKSMMGLRTKYISKQVNVKEGSGTLYLTNQRLIFVITKGMFSKTTQILHNATLNEIENISISGTLGKGLNIDWAGGTHARYTGLDDINAWNTTIRAIVTGEIE